MTNDITTPKKTGDYVSVPNNHFSELFKQAEILAQSNIIPKEFQRNPSNCFIALDIAMRLNTNPFAVMQNMYIIHGKPSFSSSYIIATINTSGKFKPLKFKISGEGDDYGCVCWTEDQNGNILESTRITVAMAKAEGWFGKNGSKWKTMLDQMLKYRSATFFGRLHCPELLMGMYSVDEIEDTKEYRDVTPTNIKSGTSDIITKIQKMKQPESQELEYLDLNEELQKVSDKDFVTYIKTLTEEQFLQLLSVNGHNQIVKIEEAMKVNYPKIADKIMTRFYETQVPDSEQGGENGNLEQ